MKQNKTILTIMLGLGVLTTDLALGQSIENEFQTRTEVKLSLDLTKKFTLSVIPEVRWNESFNVDKYLLESRIEYKAIKGLSVSGGYRFIINPRNTQSTEYLHRFAFAADYGLKIQRWKPSLRIKYTNYTEDASIGDYLRYRAKLKYDIPKFKLNPVVGIEGFHDLTDKELYKMRYSIGTSYKFNKHHSIGMSYILDYYMQEYLNKHIINIGYKYKF